MNQLSSSQEQDQWWLSGIFRDVFLLGFPQEAHFEDLTVHTILDEQYRDATLKVEVAVSGAGTVKLKLLDDAQAEGKPKSIPRNSVFVH